MKKLFLLPILALPFLAGCNSSNDSGERMINDFETIQELSLMKFPSKSHNDRATIELSDQYVTHGQKSMKFTNIYGSIFEMHHFFTNTSSGKIDGSNIRSIEVDIFNDSRFDTNAKLIIYNNNDLDILLEEEFELLKGLNNHLSFNLSKIALDNNSTTLISSSLVLYTPETNYTKGIGYTFYIDNWHAVMGSQMTDEDAKNQALIDKVRDRIDALPGEKEITLDDADKLAAVANEIGEIDTFYRRIIPNISAFNDRVAAYYKLLKFATIPNGKDDVFLPTTEFAGIASINTLYNTKASISFSPKWKAKETDAGSTQIDFSGSIHSFFAFNGLVSLKEYDYLQMTIHNETGHMVRIWFSNSNLVYADMYDGETITVKLKASLLLSQPYWYFDQLKGDGTGTVVPSTGSIYIGECHALAESVEDKIADMIYAFTNLPQLSALSSEDSYVKNAGYIAAARELYGIYGEKYGSVIPQYQLDLLAQLETKYASNGYVCQMSAYRSTFGLYHYGKEVLSTSGVRDDRFGFATKVNIPNKPVNQQNPLLLEQAIIYENEVLNKPSSNGYVINVYNPTNNQVRFTVKNSGWKWEEYDKYFTSGVLQPNSWTKIEINPILLSDEASELNGTDNKFVLFLHADNDGNQTLVGDWLFSSLVGIPRTI